MRGRRAGIGVGGRTGGDRLGGVRLMHRAAGQSRRGRVSRALARHILSYIDRWLSGPKEIRIRILSHHVMPFPPRRASKHCHSGPSPPPAAESNVGCPPPASTSPISGGLRVALSLRLAVPPIPIPIHFRLRLADPIRLGPDSFLLFFFPSACLPCRLPLPRCVTYPSQTLPPTATPVTSILDDT